jgi:hypothetical protein
VSSPTTRSLAYMREDRGYQAEVVEKWIPQARKRKDLFNIIDIVAVKRGETVGVQCTSDSNVAARVRKIQKEPRTLLLLSVPWTIEVHGWKKKGGRWVVRVVNVGKLPAWTTTPST